MRSDPGGTDLNGGGRCRRLAELIVSHQLSVISPEIVAAAANVGKCHTGDRQPTTDN